MRAGILRILPISRAGGTPLPMAGRLTQLAKIFPLGMLPAGTVCLAGCSSHRQRPGSAALGADAAFGFHPGDSPKQNHTS